MPETVEVLAGSCFCGCVRFQLVTPTEFASHCHCHSCRKSHGAAFVTWTSVPENQFRWVSGKEQLTTYSSSDTVDWQFCKVCGSSCFYRSKDAPGRLYVTVSSLSHLDREIESHVSFEEAAPWLKLDSSIPRMFGKTSRPCQ